MSVRSTCLRNSTVHDPIWFSRVCSAHRRLTRTIVSVTNGHRTRASIRNGMPITSGVWQGQPACRYSVDTRSVGKEEASVIDILEDRGLINQLAGDRTRLQELCVGRKVGVYCGVDATAKSLHVGHMVPFMALFWMCLYGHTSISLIGGATCRIGDPTGRLTSRDTLDSSSATANIASINEQLQRLWKNVRSLAERHEMKTVNMQERILNNEAWAEVGFLTILRTLGTGFRIGAMLAKDTVRNKLDKGDGMSYAEFSYPLMQAWDWWHLYNSEDKVRLQIGGSDQYGNITAGIDAVNHMRQAEGKRDDVLGFTVPLLTTSSGEKFGKSAGNAVWLDRGMKDPSSLYQYFVSTPDADVEKLLKFFTFLPLRNIAELMIKHNEDPSQRLAQHTLAFEFVALAHGLDEAHTVQARQRAIFNKQSSIEEVIQGAPSIHLPASEVWNQSISKVLHKTGLALSTGAASRLIKSGGVYVGFNEKDEIAWKPIAMSQTQYQLTHADALLGVHGEKGKTLLLRAGKTNVRALHVLDD